MSATRSVITRNTSQSSCSNPQSPSRVRGPQCTCEQIRRNGEVDLFAKMATQLAVPYYYPIRPQDIAVCGSLWQSIQCCAQLVCCFIW